MITRSCARAERALGKSIANRRRTERRKKLGSSDNFATPYNLRSSMGRKVGKSSKAIGNRSDAEHSSEVAPIRLFALPEEEMSLVQRKREV